MPVGIYLDYNALGQRIKKSGGSAGTVLTVFDEAGHLLGEYNSTGGLVQETVWLGDTPVATIRPGKPAVVYYVHADHLNAPRMVTRPSDNKIAWRWDTDPFGTVAPNQNPQSLGTFVYNLRYPGQYYDSETGLSYNYFRDYDPQTGRYIESDPVGLRAGVNTYAYVRDNPVDWADALGLFDPQAAAAYLNDPANGYTGTLSGGQCATAVRGALNAGGEYTPNHPKPAADYAKYLPTLGFSPVGMNDYQPQIGDIAVFPAMPGHDSGHIEMYDGHGWHSDYVQPSKTWDGFRGFGFFPNRSWLPANIPIFRKPLESAPAPTSAPCGCQQ